MRAKLLTISGEALIDLLHGRMWVRNLPADASVGRIGVDILTDSVGIAVISQDFPEHLPGNTLELFAPEIVNPSPFVMRDLTGAVTAVGLTRWIDPASPDAKTAIQSPDVTLIPTKMPPTPVPMSIVL